MNGLQHRLFIRTISTNKHDNNNYSLVPLCGPENARVARCNRVDITEIFVNARVLPVDGNHSFFNFPVTLAS